jgi:hypothetical protein
MAENIEKLILDDSGFINPLKESIKVMEEAERAFKDLNNAQAQGGQKVAQEVKKNYEMQGKAIEDVKKKQQELRKETIDSAKDQKFFGVSLNDVTTKLNDIKAKLQGYVSVVTGSIQVTKTQQDGIDILTKGLGGGAKAWKAMAIGVNIFKAALVATGIGALIVALGGLVSFLTSTQKGMDLVSQKTAFLGGAFDVAKGKANEVGNAIVESFSNGTVIQDFGQLLQDQITNRVTGIIDVFKNLWSVVSGGGKTLSDVGASLGQVVTGINAETIKETAKEMLETAKAAEAIQKQLTALKREQAAYNVEFATTRAQIEQLKKIGDDTSKTFGERTNAIKKAGALEQQINAKNLEFISREIELTQKRINIKGAENVTDEDRQKVYDLQLKKAELINDTAGKSTELQNTLNGLLKEQKDLLNGISDNLIKIGREYNLVTEKEEFEFIKAKQIEQLELFIKQLKDVGQTLGKDVTGQINIAQQAIDGLNSRDFTSTFEPISKLAKDLRPASQEIKILEKRLKDLQDININFGIDNTVTQEKIKQQIEKLTKDGLKSENVLKIQFKDIEIIGSKSKIKFYDDFLNGIEDFEGLLQKTLDEIFGDEGGEKAREFLKGVATLVGEFGNILNESTNIQLGNIDKQLDKLSERRETLQDELSRELELQEKGLANNVGNKQAEVDGLLAEEARLQAEKERIQKEAQKRQLISDTIAQGQSLITSSINIIKGFSNIPIVGLPLGIAAVGALLAFFAKTKIEAFKATKLYSGAERISDHFGYGERHGDTDLPGRGSGYRLINERTGKPTNVIISGKEMLLPESVSLPNTEFFHSLRNGVYNGIDLNAAMGFYLNYKGKVQKATQNTVIVAQNQPQSKNKARVAIPHTLKNGRKGVIITTIKDDWTDGKFIEFDL